MERTKRIRSGDWRTVEVYVNASGTAFFQQPAGARIKVRYSRFAASEALPSIAATQRDWGVPGSLPLRAVAPLLRTVDRSPELETGS